MVKKVNLLWHFRFELSCLILWKFKVNHSIFSLFLKSFKGSFLLRKCRTQSLILSTFSYRFVSCLKSIIFRQNLMNRSTGSPATNPKISVASSVLLSDVAIKTADRLLKRSTVSVADTNIKLCFWVTYKRLKFYFAHSKKDNKIFWNSLSKKPYKIISFFSWLYSYIIVHPFSRKKLKTLLSQSLSNN